MSEFVVIRDEDEEKGDDVLNCDVPTFRDDDMARG